ncbi:MAG: Lipid-A-disaccharide synthase [Chthoniobacteraceae bacterium]|nr:Lipid-A-disaccharide synthase [Chthoniobacteraceae bacterium]
MKLYLVAGEASGDARGAELMRALLVHKPGLLFLGAGGPEMQALAGSDFLDWADEAVVGLWDVLKKYGYFKAQFDRMLADIEMAKPAAVVLIDYPGFNLRLAKALHKRVPSLKIIYYISPQVWAWNRGRIGEMAGYLDLMLCIFPFEKPLYEKSGLKTVFVGHPMLDSLAAKRIGAERVPQLVGLFPGSRQKEIRKIFPTMIAAARLMQSADHSLRFEAAAASETVASSMRALLSEAGMEENWCPVSLRGSHSLMQRAAAGMVTSGTATLEAAFFGMPLVILYKVAWLTFVIGKRLIKVDFLGMPNLLAGREIAREFLQDAAQPEPIAKEMLRLLTDTAARDQLQRELANVIAGLGDTGAGVRAAEAISGELGFP